MQYFLTAVAGQARDALRRARRLHALRELYRSRVTSVRASSLLPRLVDVLLETPAMTINRAAKVLGVTHRAATLTVARLVAAGLLIEVEPAGRTRLFLAREIIAVVSGEQTEVDDDTD